ncbi:hypothetical protein GCM10025862_25650 [Arsenicicoccus piscis]|uniref:Isoprenyl transferase n=1 Tax=Arsenicicoccus piscis TaxID=673954 RepID=A0ABQ6HPZ4_9MICO|nr:hypothetical protein GCM10025862_25650 [Arsenicicoccus piscis]
MVPLTIHNPLYTAYERLLLSQLDADRLPRHVGVMLDGNRRWAKAKGAGTAEGHQAGADRIEHLLEWCDEVGIEYATLWLLSTDNLNRPAAELSPLLGIIEGAVRSSPSRTGGGSTRWVPWSCCRPTRRPSCARLRRAPQA